MEESSKMLKQQEEIIEMKEESITEHGMIIADKMEVIEKLRRDFEKEKQDVIVQLQEMEES
jgi:hypothetical protein